MATSQAICEYRARAGTDGPLFLGRDTHALSEPAFVDALEVFAANGVRVLVDAQDTYTPTPAVSHAILTYNRGRSGGLADGVVVTPSHNPPADGGFKYNPPHGGPADTDVTRWIQERANKLLGAGLQGVRRMTYAKARARRHHRQVRLHPRVRLRPGCGGRPRRGALGRDPDRCRPARRRLGAVLGRDRRPLRPRPHGGQPARRPDLAVHDAGLGRQDPDGLLLAVRDGVADQEQGRLPDRDRQRRGRRPARDRHPGRRPAQPEPLPRGRDPLPVRAPGRLAGRRPRSARRSCPRG